MTIKTAAMPKLFSKRTGLALAAAMLALVAVPHMAEAQGVFRGAEQGANQGSREGNRAAGPVGGLVGGAIGLGVGGAVGGVKGVLGIPEGRRTQCRGYYNRAGKFRCYR
ncbi:MAG: hypothetical protein EON84_15245 [Bradyrhizobiaceae bacterium]|jgi:hypothetical protein|nr:MAG: hypothetical protein EON84_15245 [Bradyrhizobiaceae bacterium]